MHQKRVHDDVDVLADDAINSVIESVEIDQRRINCLSSFVPVDHGQVQLVYSSDDMPPELMEEESSMMTHHQSKKQQRFVQQVK